MVIIFQEEEDGIRMYRLFFLSFSKVSMLFCSFDIDHPTVLNSSSGGGSGAVVVKVKDTTSGWKKKKKKKKKKKVIIREISLLENKRRAWRR